MPEFVTTGTRDDGGCMISVSGEVDIANVEEFLTVAQGCLESGATLVEVDLSEVTFIDSSGLGALVRLRNQARERDVVVVLRRVPEFVGRLLEVTGLTAAFGPEG